MRPRSICPTTPALTHEEPEGPSRVHGISRSLLSSTGSRPGARGENEAIFLDISDCCVTSSATAERWSRSCSGASPRPSRAGLQQAARYQGRDQCLTTHMRPGAPGENEAIFLDINDCCKTGSATAERWSLARSGAGPWPSRAGLHQAARYRGRDRGLESHRRHEPVGENEPIFLDVSDCYETSSAVSERWSRTRFGVGPRPSRVGLHRAARYRGRDQCLASHMRPGAPGENEAIFLDINDCCETSFELAERWSRARFGAGPSQTRAGLHQAARYRGSDQGLASHVRPGAVGENEAIFLDINDCCETSSAAAQRWSRTRTGASPRRVHATAHQGRHSGRDRSQADRGLATHGRPWLGRENEPISLDVTHCCETSSAASERWSRTRSGVGPSTSARGADGSLNASARAGRLDSGESRARMRPMTREPAPGFDPRGGATLQSPIPVEW
jgi:hypothetical protein